MPCASFDCTNIFATIRKTQYWLELLRDAELVKSDKAFTSLCDDCTELIKLLTSSVKTAKVK